MQVFNSHQPSPCERTCRLGVYHARAPTSFGNDPDVDIVRRSNLAMGNDRDSRQEDLGDHFRERRTGCHRQGDRPSGSASHQDDVLRHEGVVRLRVESARPAARERDEVFFGFSAAEGTAQAVAELLEARRVEASCLCGTTCERRYFVQRCGSRLCSSPETFCSTVSGGISYEPEDQRSNRPGSKSCLHSIFGRTLDHHSHRPL